MSDMSGWEAAAIASRESEQRAALALLRQLTEPFDLGKIAGWVEDPAVAHHPLALGVMRVLVAEIRRLRKVEHDLLNEIQARVARMGLTEMRLRKALRDFCLTCNEVKVNNTREFMDYLRKCVDESMAVVDGKDGAS